MKSIIKFNQNEKKKLNDLETEEFIKSQESRLMRESKDVGTNNVGDIEAIADGLKMVAEKLSNVEAQNEDLMRRLNRIYENLGEQKLLRKKIWLCGGIVNASFKGLLWL